MTTPVAYESVGVVLDFSDFGRQLEKGIDSAMRGVIADLRASFRTVESAAGEAGKQVGREFQNSGEVAERALREVGTQARQSFGQVEREASQAAAGISAKLGGAIALVKTSLITLGVGAAAGLAAITGFGLKSAAELEQVQISFNSLLGSVEKGTAVFKDLQNFAATTPFEFPEVAGAAQRFLAFNDAVGLSDDQLRPFLTTIGNLASVTGAGAQGLNSVTLAMGQIASSGKVTLENLNQISEALPGFSGVAAIASATGKTTAEVMAQISAGELDAATGIQALLAGMNQFPGAAGAMEAQSKTLLGVFSTFKDTLSQTLAGAFAPVIPGIKDSLSELTPILGDALGELAPLLGQALAGILPLVGKLVKAIVPILGPLITALGPALDALGPALEPLGEALGQVLVALSPILPVLGEFLAAVAQLLVPVLLLLAVVLKPLMPLFEFLAFTIGMFADALAKIDWAAVGRFIVEAFVEAWDAAWEFFVNIGKWFADLPQQARLAFAFVASTIEAKINEAVDYVKSIPPRVVAALGDFGALLVQKGRDLISGLWNGISAMGGWLWQKVKDFAYNNTVGAFKNALGISSPSTVMAKQVGEWIPPGVGVGIERSAPSLVNMIDGLLASAGNASAAAGLAASQVVNVGGVHFAGALPTASEAAKVGQVVGDAAARALALRSVQMAVRMAS